MKTPVDLADSILIECQQSTPLTAEAKQSVQLYLKTNLEKIRDGWVFVAPLIADDFLAQMHLPEEAGRLFYQRINEKLRTLKASEIRGTNFV